MVAAGAVSHLAPCEMKPTPKQVVVLGLRARGGGWEVSPESAESTGSALGAGGASARRARKADPGRGWLRALTNV